MPNVTLPLTSFTGGEWSPRLYGRVDLQKYSTACEELKNMTILPYGGVTRRMGTRFINSAKSNTNIRLIPFEYNREQAYVLELGPNYIRFYRSDMLLYSGGTPIEVATPFTSSEINSVSFAQANDVMYLVHQNHSPRKLTRTGADVFSLSIVTFTAKPTEWNTSLNQPRAVTFYQNRLVFAGPPLQPQTIWMSKVSDLENFTNGSAANDALKYTLSSTQNNAIQWLVPGKKLMIGTMGGEFSFDLPLNNGLNVNVQRVSNFGSKNGRTQLIGNGIIYISRDGKKIREMAYDYQEDGFTSPEISLFAEHLIRNGAKEYAYAPNPGGILWVLTDAGNLSGMTYLKEQEVQAWHRHETFGDIVSICSIETPTGSELWMAVRRSSFIRIEKMAYPFIEGYSDDFTSAFLDSHVTYYYPGTATLGGLYHIEGQTVSVIADGIQRANQVVDGGAITVESSDFGNIIVGLPYEWKVIPLRLEGGSPAGFSQGKRKRIESIVLRVEKSAGINYKIKNGATFNSIPLRSPGEYEGDPINLYTGDKRLVMPNSWNYDGQFELFGDAPFPVTILMASAEVTVNE